MENMKMEAFLNDNVVIPEDIKNMTREELEKAIAQLENELKKRKSEKGKNLGE